MADSPTPPYFNFASSDMLISFSNVYSFGVSVRRDSCKVITLKLLREENQSRSVSPRRGFSILMFTFLMSNIFLRTLFSHAFNSCFPRIFNQSWTSRNATTRINVRLHYLPVLFGPCDLIHLTTGQGGEKLESWFMFVSEL
jgi:hypothetical protein